MGTQVVTGIRGAITHRLQTDSCDALMSGIQCHLCGREAPGENGAGERNRTPDRLITNQLLYLLSYASHILIFNEAGILVEVVGGRNLIAVIFTPFQSFVPLINCFPKGI